MDNPCKWNPTRHKIFQVIGSIAETEWKGVDVPFIEDGYYFYGVFNASGVFFFFLIHGSTEMLTEF